MALKTYEKQLLDLVERSNVQQGRIMAACLAQKEVNSENASQLLLGMNKNFDSRIRIIDKKGLLLSDSASIDSSINSAKKIYPENEIKDYSSREAKIVKKADERFIYKLLSLPIRVYRKFFRPPSQNPFSTDYYTSRSRYDGKEIEMALNGKYGSITRFSTTGNGVTLYSALPIQDSKSSEIKGVVLVSRSTYKILQNLYELRLDLGKVFIASVVFVILISIFFLFRITIPLKKLAKESQESADNKGRLLSTSFTGIKRHDEIGVLSRSFSELMEKLRGRIKFIESFSSDVSHEFKNPLTAIRSCSELLENQSLSESERKEITRAITEEVNHLQKLLTGVRNISKIDAGSPLEYENTQTPLCQSCKNIITRLKKIFNNIDFVFNSSDEEYYAKIPSEYFDRLAENLIENAASFASSTVKINILKDNNEILFQVEDDGKGIEESEKEKIFTRFYSNRPENDRGNHTGLGLSTVMAIIQAINGKINLSKSEYGGASFSVTLKNV